MAAVQEKQHGVPDDTRAARGALLEDVPRPALRSSKALMSSKFTGRSVGQRIHPSVGQSGLPARGAASSAAGQLGVEEGASSLWPLTAGAC